MFSKLLMGEHHLSYLKIEVGVDPRTFTLKEYLLLLYFYQG